MASGVGAVALAACGSSGGSSTGAVAADIDAQIPEETAGPFPADGSNGPDVLTQSGIVRRDITTSFGGLKGTAEGVPTTINLKLLDVAGGGGPLGGAAVYLLALQPRRAPIRSTTPRSPIRTTCAAFR